MKHRLHAEVDIEATPKTVWQILADLERYSEWNPFVVSSHGTVAVGERLVNRLQPPGGKARTFKPTVSIVEAGETLEWLGHLGFRNLFDGRHRFDLSATPTGTRFTQSEEFSGVLVRFMRRSLDGDTLRGFEAMNAALKTRAEAHDAAS